MMLQNGYAEEAPLKIGGIEWYIPQHAVYNINKPGNVRVVIDCSAKYHNQSLNDHILQGPDLLNSLITVLCKFREDHIAFIGDIEKMFYHFKVKDEHRDYLRFLWWKNGDMNSQPISYRVTVHIFSAISSRGCANFALKRIAIDHKDKYSTDVVNFLCKHFYVDDGIYSVGTVQEAIQLVNAARELCTVGNLRLHKFVSNSR